MKITHGVLINVLVLIISVPVLAQKDIVVGKWSYVGMDNGGGMIDLEDPITSKKRLAALIEKEVKQKPDSTELETIYNAMVSSFKGTTVEFTSAGLFIFAMPISTGEIKSDTAKYTVDYDKAMLSVVLVNHGEKQKVKLDFRFENGYLIIVDKEKEQIIKAKRTNK